MDSDEDDDYYSRISSTTEDTSVSRQRAYPKKHRNRNHWEISRVIILAFYIGFLYF